MTQGTIRIRGARQHNLKNLDLDIRTGELTVVTGPSGSGKSVLLKHIVGLERPTAGRVTVDGRDAAAESTREQVRMALVFQSGALFNSLSVYDNLALYPREHRIAKMTLHAHGSRRVNSDREKPNNVRILRRHHALRRVLTLRVSP